MGKQHKLTSRQSNLSQLTVLVLEYIEVKS